MKSIRNCAFLAAVVLSTVYLAACGPSMTPLASVTYPALVQSTKVKVNDTELSAFVMDTESLRRRARLGLAPHENEVIAYLYPESKDAVHFSFPIGITEAVDLIFVDANAKVIQSETVSAFTNTNFDKEYVVKDVRLVLEFQQGQAKKLKLDVGSTVKLDPNLLATAAKAGPAMVDLYFTGDRKADEKPEVPPCVHLKLLDKPEEFAQAMKDRPDFKDGDGIVAAYGQTGSIDGFWLKEVNGPVCACFIERASGAGGSGLLISNLYENIKDDGTRDLDRPIFTPQENASYIVIFKGATFFTDHKITKRTRVSFTGMDNYGHEEIDYRNVEIKFGDRKLRGRVVNNDVERAAALLDAPKLETGKATVFDFDDVSLVAIDPSALKGEARLLFISGDGTSKYSIREQKMTSASPVIKMGDCKDGRFVIAVPKDFDIKDFEMPYVLRDLQPSLPTIVFYGAKDDVVTDRWPKTPKGKAHVELAYTDAEQRKGLMYRTSLKPDHGMMFIYKAEEDEMNYWMKNCRMDLSIAFIDHKGTIVKIHNRMKAQPIGTADAQLENYSSDGPAIYAIEMEPDWYDKHDIKAGDRVYIPANVTKTEK